MAPGQTHPYEGTLKAECIKADAALSAYRVWGSGLRSKRRNCGR